MKKILAIDLLGPNDKLLSIAEKNVKQTLWSLRKSFLTFVMFIKMRKSRPKSFLHWKVCLFSKKIVLSTFQQPRRSWRIDIITNTVTMKKPWRPLQTVLWGLSHLIKREKGGHNFFPHLERLPFFSKNCVFNNLSRAEEMILYLTY